MTAGKLPAEFIANWSLTGTGSNINEEFSYQVIPANDAR
jgi:hypothetical protein